MRVANRKTHVLFGSILFGIAAVSICVAFSGWPHAAFARTTESECRTWAHVAAKENGIPPRILQAIAMVESRERQAFDSETQAQGLHLRSIGEVFGVNIGGGRMIDISVLANENRRPM